MLTIRHPFIVGRDWPDNFYATNAKWPSPNQWWKNPDKSLQESLTTRFRASKEEMKKAREIEEREAARKESRKLKKQLFQAIVQVWRAWCVFVAVSTRTA
jgi:hypothetical protein